jgi:hypothetical protein
MILPLLPVAMEFKKVLCDKFDGVLCNEAL